MQKVSVIVPVYNVENYIERCLNSLVHQTLEEIQIIIVNDGSTDGSEDIIFKFMDRYRDKILYLKKENGGLSDARNFGLRFADGEYVAFLDSDDYVNLTLYEKMYNKAVETNADMVECNFYWEYENDKRILDDTAKYKDESDKYANARVVAWNKLYKRNLLVKTKLQFPKGLKYEDVEFYYKILPYLQHIELIEEPLIYYVQRSASLCNTQNASTKDIFKILDNVISYYKENNLFDKYAMELEYMYVRIMFGSSLKRVCKISDKTLRENTIKETYARVYSMFPNWKKNKILNTNLNFKKVYLQSINKLTLNIYTKFL